MSSNTATRQLDVYINTAQIGRLFENNGLWQFQYKQSWLQQPHAFSLAPYLPMQPPPHVDNGSYRPVQWFFDNLLPEEQARELLAKHIKVSTEDAFGILEAIGGESAGAITLLPPATSLPKGDIAQLSKEDLSRRIQNLPRSPMNSGERKRMSLAGAQHKMLLVLDDKTLYEPIGQTPSTHILKPEHTSSDVYYFTVRNEYTIMRLAQASGLQVPKVHIDYVPQACYLVERFDRKGTLANTERLHVLDGCQVLGLSAGAKYRKNTIETLLKLQQLCRSKGLTALKLYRWVLFNFLVGNSDAHLKNLSFRLQQGGDIELLPHYDLLSTIIYAPMGESQQEQLSQPLGEASRFGQVTKDSFIELAKQFGLKPSIAEKEIRKLSRQLNQAMENEYQQLEQAPTYPGKVGELRMLRQIQFLALQPHIAQITNS
ncbi:MAG: HipA domain-containing protein [Pseudomonadota bacterium]